MSYEPGSFPRLSCLIPVQKDKSSAHGDFPSGNRAVDGQTEGYLQAASGIVSVLQSTAWMGWKSLRIQGFYSPATLRNQAPLPGNGWCQPGSQHSPQGHPAGWVLDLGYRHTQPAQRKGKAPPECLCSV